MCGGMSVANKLLRAGQVIVHVLILAVANFWIIRVDKELGKVRRTRRKFESRRISNVICNNKPRLRTTFKTGVVVVGLQNRPRICIYIPIAHLSQAADLATIEIALTIAVECELGAPVVNVAAPSRHERLCAGQLTEHQVDRRAKGRRRNLRKHARSQGDNENQRDDQKAAVSFETLVYLRWS
jgi:hypothetical protein